MRVGFAGLVVLLLTGLAGAQDARRTVISTETRVVLVDTIVTDKKGNYIRDLTTKDFRVWEDGREQKVTGVSLQSGTASSPTDKKNYVLVLFDNTTMAEDRQKHLKTALSGFVSDPKTELALAVAVYSGGMSMVQNFTSDTGRMIRAIESVPPPAVSSTFSTSASARGTAADARPAPGSALMGDANAQDQTMRAFLLDLGALARSMTSVPGRKALVLLTGGFSVPEGALNEFKGAIDLCNRANVAIYPLDVRGLSAVRASLDRPSAGLWASLLPRAGAAFDVWPVSASADFQSRRSPNNQNPTPGVDAVSTLDSGMEARQVLDSLAAETGGFVLRNSNDLLSALRRVVAEHDEYYAISYTPSADVKIGCHALRVQVSHRGAQVRSRNSYCFAKPSDVLAGTPEERELEKRITTAPASVPASNPAASSSVASMQAPFFYAAPNLARVNLALEFRPAGLRFNKVQGKLHAEINVLAIAYGAMGEPASRFSDVAKFDFDKQSDIDSLNGAFLHYDNQFELAPGQYNLKVAYGATGRAAETLESPLSIDPFDDAHLAVSALALSRNTRTALDSDPEIQLALLEGRVPLMFRGNVYTPSGESRFQSGEPVRVYMELYDPRLLSGPTEVNLRMTVVDRRTGAQLINTDMGNVGPLARAGTNVIPIGFTIAGRSPGAYRVEVQASGAAGSASRTVEFDVN